MLKCRVDAVDITANKRKIVARGIKSNEDSIDLIDTVGRLSTAIYSLINKNLEDLKREMDKLSVFMALSGRNLSQM